MLSKIAWWIVTVAIAVVVVFVFVKAFPLVLMLLGILAASFILAWWIHKLFDGIWK